MSEYDFLVTTNAFPVAAVRALIGDVGQQWPDPLRSLKFVVSTLMSGAEPSLAALDALADDFENRRVQHGALNVLMMQAAPVSRLKIEREGGWDLGAPVHRVEVLRRLVQRSRGDGAAAERAARAAVLLAIEEGLMIGPGLAYQCVIQEGLAEKTGWPSYRIQKVIALVQTEEQVTREFFEIMERAARPLDEMNVAATAPLPSEKLNTIANAIDAMAELPGRRVHIRWRVANYLWKVINLCKGLGDPGAANQFIAKASQYTRADEPHMVRWLNQACVLRSPPDQWWSCLRLPDPPPKYEVVRFV